MSVFIVHADECTGKGECFAVGGEDGGIYVSCGRKKERNGDEHYTKDNRHNGYIELLHT